MMPITLRYLPALHRQSVETRYPVHFCLGTWLSLTSFALVCTWNSESHPYWILSPACQSNRNSSLQQYHSLCYSVYNNHPHLSFFPNHIDYSGTPLFCTPGNHNPYLPSVMKRWWRKQGTLKRTTPTRSYKNVAQRHSKKQQNVPDGLPEIRFLQNIDKSFTVEEALHKVRVHTASLSRLCHKKSPEVWRSSSE